MKPGRTVFDVFQDAAKRYVEKVGVEAVNKELAEKAERDKAKKENNIRLSA